MVPGGHSSFPALQVNLSNLIFSASNSLKAQLQHVEERCAQRQRRFEELQKRKVQLLEVLRVFEMIEENEKAKTKQLEYELERAEQDATDRYREMVGESGSWTGAPISRDDVFGPTVPNSVADSTENQHPEKHVHFAELDRLGATGGTQEDHRKSSIPLFCKQMIATLRRASEDNAPTKVQEASAGTTDENLTRTEHISTNPRAPLVAAEDGHTRRRQVKKALALEKAKHKAAETFKMMPHKARRKLKGAHPPNFAPKKTLAYTGQAIRSMANGIGTMGGLWNSHQRLEEGMPASETWPEAMRTFLTSGSTMRVIGADSAEGVNEGY